MARLLPALVAPCLLAASLDASGATCAVLAYHRFGPGVADSMTVRTANFEQQIKLLREHGYQTVPLATHSMLALPRFLVTDGYTAAGLLHALDRAAASCPSGLR